MSSPADAITRMSKKKPPGEGGAQKRSPAVTVYARLPPELGKAFNRHIDTLRPRASAQAVVEMLVERWLTEEGKWPPPPPN